MAHSVNGASVPLHQTQAKLTVKLYRPWPFLLVIVLRARVQEIL